MSTSLQGLARATSPSTGPGFDPATDPLGVALMARARQQDFTNTVNDIQSDYGPTGSPLAAAAHEFGPLPDQNWEGFWQAMQESSGGRPTRIIGSAVGPDLGFDTNNGTVGAGTEVYGPRGLRLNKGGS